MNIIVKILLMIILYISHVIAHEFGHYMILKLYNQEAVLSFGCGKLLLKLGSFEVRANPLMSYVECSEDITHENLFYFAGIASNIIVFLITFLFLNQFNFVWIYSMIVMIGNIIFISPVADMYRLLHLDKYIKLTEDQEIIWNIVCLLLSVLILIGYVVWFFIRY